MRHATYWLTRDEDAYGALSDMIDVWLARPERLRTTTEHGAVWIGAGDTGLDTRHTQWTVAFALTECRVYPETSIECIRVGPEPVAPTED